MDNKLKDNTFPWKEEQTWEYAEQSATPTHLDAFVQEMVKNGVSSMEKAHAKYFDQWLRYYAPSGKRDDIIRAFEFMVQDAINWRNSR
jgi:hypothetical protein